MKTLAIIFMIIIFFLMIGFGFFYLLGFAMSFDAPGSDKDPSAWMMRLLMFLPGVILLAALIFALISFSSGHYNRSVIISLIPLSLSVMFILYMSFTSYSTMAAYNNQQQKEAADAEKYPVQKFMRQVEGGADTVIVFPSRIVAYRLYAFNRNPYGGPLGDLNEKRTTIIYNNSSDTKLPFIELDQFVDIEGRRFTEVYRISELGGVN